jgi:hypothetical protein
LDLISRPDLALVDALAIDERSGLVAEIDQRDVAGGADLDDRVHTRCELVVHAQVTSRILSDLDDVLGDRVPADELIPLIQRERQRNFCLTLALHR